MKISLDWLGDFVNLDGVSAAEVADLLSLRTAEVEGLEILGEDLSGVVVGEVLTCEPHPQADRLSVTDIAFGGPESVAVVCGAPNVRKGLKVAFAPVGTRLPGNLKIKKAKLRGVASFGMICSAAELQLSDAKDGILELDAAASVGASLVSHLGLEDSVLEIDNKSLTHRPDLWGHWGMAREVAAILGRPMTAPSFSSPWEGFSESPQIDIVESSACSYYSALCFSLADGPQESPAWLTRRLRAVGQRPIHDVVDLTNYILMELGQPTHVFDAARVGGDRLQIRVAKPGECLTTLDGQDRALLETDLVIADASVPLALAGVMGGQSSEVHSGTTAVLLESANFDAVRVRRCAARLALRTESSSRFEKSLDPALAELATRRYVHLLGQIRPEIEILGAPSFAGSAEKLGLELQLDPKRTSVLLGLPALTSAEVAKPLQDLGFSVSKSGDQLNVKVPSWRAQKDISEEIDLVEEVGRFIGYENIPSEALPWPAEFHAPDPIWHLRRRLARRLGGAWAAFETESYSFLNSSWHSRLGLQREDFFQLVHPVQDGVSLIRRDPIPSLLEQAVSNLRERDSGSLFEFAKGYEPGSDEVLERNWLGVVLWGQEGRSDGPFSLFGKARSLTEDLLFNAGVAATPTVAEDSPDQRGQIYSWSHPKRGLTWEVDGQVVGFSGCPDPRVVAELDGAGVSWGVVLLDLIKLSELATEGSPFQSPSRFPGIKVDLALAMPKAVPYAEVAAGVRKAGGKILETVELFDLFEGGSLPEDHRSLGLRVVLRAADRTLEDKDERRFLERASAAAQSLGGKLRDQTV